MAHENGNQPATIWDVIVPQLPQKAETPLRFIARALQRFWINLTQKRRYYTASARQ
jgi:hypothetical protein